MLHEYLIFSVWYKETDFPTQTKALNLGTDPKNELV